MSPLLLIVVYCVLILLASLAGGMVPLLIRLTHTKMQVAISFVAGLMLGVGLLHMLPHAIAEVGMAGLDQVVACLLFGFLAMFFVERFFSFHHHDVEDEHQSHAAHELTWSGAAVGLTLHSVLAGIALAASVEAESGSGQQQFVVGLATFLVIFLHKPFDSMTLGTLMAVGDWPLRVRHLINGLFALAIPVGAVLFYVGVGGSQGAAGAALAWALAFSAGMFLCIAMSDLLPELQFHRHDRIKLSVALVLGLALAWAIGQFEPHGHGQHEHDHHEKTPAVRNHG